MIILGVIKLIELRNAFSSSYNPKEKIAFGVGLTCLVVTQIAVAEYSSYNSESYASAKAYILQSNFVKDRTGQIVAIQNFPSYISANDTIWYFTKVNGDKAAIYVMCIVTQASAKQWRLVTISENQGQFYQLKRRMQSQPKD